MALSLIELVLLVDPGMFCHLDLYSTFFSTERLRFVL